MGAAVEVPLLGELKRRRVFRALVAYGIAAFAVLQIVEPVMHGFRWPDAVLSYVVLALAAGFPIVVALAWIFDVNQGHIERTRGEPLRARLALALLGLGALAAAPGLFWYFRIRSPPASPAPSIAVLPFADMSPAKDQEYLSDGIAEEILNALAQVEGLRVAGRTSSFSFKGRNEELPAIAEKLHVANVLEGSVRKDGNHIRITAQLISAADGYHVWSKTFDRELAGVFAVQDEVARAVVDALRLKLVAPERRPTNPEAYAQFLFAIELDRQYPDRKTPIAALERSVALDPTYAPAWARLAFDNWALMGIASTASEVAKARDDMVKAADRAMTLAPQQPDSYYARALVRSALFDWDGARADFRRALELAPSDSAAHFGYGRFLSDLGEFRDGERELKRAAELDPLDWIPLHGLGWTYLGQGRYSEARSAFERARDLCRDPEFEGQNLATVAVLQGDRQLAAAWDGKASAPADASWSRAAVAEFLKRSDAPEAMRAFVEQFGAAQPFDVAELYGLRGDANNAFIWLERALAARDRYLRMVKIDPSFRTLRSDPRWPVLLAKMNLRP